MSKESSTGGETGVWRVDSKLDPGVQSDRAAGQAVTRAILGCVRRGPASVWALASGFVESAAFQRAARTPWEER